MHARFLHGGKWNESSFMPPLCTYRLNWVRRTSWGWWDDWDDTVLQTQDSKFEPWRSEAEHATSRSRRLPTILTFTRGWGRNIFCFFQITETGNRTPNYGVKGSGANHYPRPPALLHGGRTGNAVYTASSYILEGQGNVVYTPVYYVIEGQTKLLSGGWIGQCCIHAKLLYGGRTRQYCMQALILHKDRVILYTQFTHRHMLKTP